MKKSFSSTISSLAEIASDNFGKFKISFEESLSHDHPSGVCKLVKEFTEKNKKKCIKKIKVKPGLIKPKSISMKVICFTKAEVLPKESSYVVSLVISYFFTKLLIKSQAPAQFTLSRES